MAHNMYKTKLAIPTTQTDILPQHKLFLCGYAVLKPNSACQCGICTGLELNYILIYNSLYISI